MSIHEFFLKNIETALNAYLNLDPESKNRIAALHGKTISIELLRLNSVFNLQFTRAGIFLKEKLDHAPDTVIKGTPLRLLRLACERKQREKFFSEDVVIDGNVELGREVIQLFDHLEIDWEEFLSQWIGDVSAHHFGKMSRKFCNWQQETAEIFLKNLREYLHEEIKLFPPREALQDFFNDVDNLRMDTDRLFARIQYLKERHENNRGNL